MKTLDTNSKSNTLRARGFATVLARKSRLLATSAVLALAGVLTVFWLVQRVPANTRTESKELDLAIARTLSAVLADPNHPKDEEPLLEAVAAALPILNPEIGLRERRKDPVFAAAEVASMALFLNAREIAAEKAQDPERRRQSEQALEALGKGANASAQEIFEAWKKREFGDSDAPTR